MNNSTQKTVKTAVMLAVATILSLVTVFKLPFGGSITPASMMPVIIIAYIYGVKWGFFSAFVYSVLQMLTGMDVVSALFIPGDSQMLIWQAISVCLIDYVLAYMMLGFAGIFKGNFKSDGVAICIGTVFSMFLTYVMHIVSGFIFYGAWAEWFFTQEGFYSFGASIMKNFSGNMLSFIYSVVYNGLYMIPEIIITAIITPIVYAILKKSVKDL